VLTLMAVHAHPDDETIQSGGVLTRYGAEGVETVLVTCTDGAVGEISDPALASPENLAAVRVEELAEACRIMGIKQRFNLGYRDSGMMGTDDNKRPNAFWQADMEEATGRLVAIIRTTRPDVIVTSNENGDYGHPDHINANRVAVAAFHAAADPARYSDQGLAPWQTRKLYYSAFPRSGFARLQQMLIEAGIELPPEESPNTEAETAAGESPDEVFGTPDDLITTEIDISAFIDTKRAALAAHRTQMGPESMFMRMPDTIWREAWGAEHFCLIESSVATPAKEDDLFLGLR
jgi:mycothiol conjugate amidase Mca